MLNQHLIQIIQTESPKRKLNEYSKHMKCHNKSLSSSCDIKKKKKNTLLFIQRSLACEKVTMLCNANCFPFSEFCILLPELS